MVTIDYTKSLSSNAKFGKKNTEAVKKDLEDLYEYDVVFEELERRFAYNKRAD